MAPSPAPAPELHLGAPVWAVAGTFPVTCHWKYPANSFILRTPGEPLLHCADTFLWQCVTSKIFFLRLLTLLDVVNSAGS